MQGIASQNAPSPSLVIPHFIAGAIVWLISTLLITLFPESLLQHYFNPHLLAITHLLVLGWITMIIFGALYQLLPVILQVKLKSEKLGYFSFVFLLTGTLFLAYSFWNFEIGTPIITGGILIGISVAGFMLNILLTTLKSKETSIEKDFIVAATWWLFFTVAAGIALAVNLTHPFLKQEHTELLKLHAHAGIAGWFLQLIFGVASKLLPMFMVSHNINQSYLKYSYLLVNAGLISALTGLYINMPVITVSGAFIVAAGAVCFILYLIIAYRHRVKRKLDTGMTQSMFAFMMLMAAGPLLFLLIFNPDSLSKWNLPMAAAYGSVLIPGFISALIQGQTYKTLPFIVWLKVYRQKVGKQKIPLPKELYSDIMARYQMYLYMAGFTAMLAGILIEHKLLVQIGAAAITVSAFVFLSNIFKIVLHKPELKTKPNE